MNLIERARNWATVGKNGTANILLEELAGEVERLWAFEKDYTDVVVPAWHATSDNLHRQKRELEAEIKRIKNTVDTTALQKAFFDGYLAAVRALFPITNTLLTACGFGKPLEDSHDGSAKHSHG
jgi:hypothetical protein